MLLIGPKSLSYKQEGPPRSPAGAFSMLGFAKLAVDKSQFVKCRVAPKYHFREAANDLRNWLKYLRVASVALRLRSAVPTCFSRLRDLTADGHAGLDDASTAAIRNTQEACVRMSEGVATTASHPGCSPARDHCFAPSTFLSSSATRYVQRRIVRQALCPTKVLVAALRTTRSGSIGYRVAHDRGRKWESRHP
jgi:hypothetical protein